MNIATKNLIMILDIQGSGYSLYDPEISTSKMEVDCSKSSNVGDEAYFYAGNVGRILWPQKSPR
jgi:hypothetical protein